MPRSPYRIALINMPFGRLSMPSLALTQLSAVLEQRFGSGIDVSVHYLNLDFASYFGDVSLYDHALSAAAHMTGIGEWFFRRSAFPEVEDNADAYYARYYFSRDETTRRIRRRFEEKRMGLDCFLDGLIDRHALLEADMVGFTALFSQTVASFAMARRIKNRNPDVMTVIGGASCDAVMGMEIAEHVPQLDAVFSGPALESLPQFVEALLHGNRAGCDHIDGVFTRTNRTQWPQRGSQPAIGLLGDPSDINDLVPLDYDSFLADLSSAFPDGEVSPVLLFETSRGCWWAEKAACSFCGLNGRQMQHRFLDPQKAIVHIESLYRYVPRCRVFMGVDTILPRGYPRAVFARLSPPPEMTMFYELRPDVTREDIQVLVGAGVRAFQAGIESLSTSTLALMRKGTSAFRNIVFLKNCTTHALRLDWNLLLFSPGEDEAVYEKTLQDIPNLAHLPPPSGAYPIGFMRFSRYFEDPGAYDLTLTPQDFYGLTYPFDEKSVANLAYHFLDSGADTAHIDAWLDRLNASIAHWTARWLGNDDRPQARLCFASDDAGWAVYDSRSGREIRTGISETEKRMLDTLDRPGSIPRLRNEFGAGTETMLDHLRDRGWLFEERGRMLSLVT